MLTDMDLSATPPLRQLVARLSSRINAVASTPAMDQQKRSIAPW
jgi:hypothetical protein